MIILFLFILLIGFPLFSKSGLAISKDFPTAGLTNNVVYNPFQGLGICHYSSPALLDDPIVSWSYDATEAVFWKTIEPVEGQFNWSSIDNLINLHQSKGKKLWLQVYNANAAAIPDWAKTKTINGQKIQFMGQDYQPYDCTNMGKDMPLVWDENYLALWQKVIHALSQRYDNNPTVEAIVMMAGGGYGEMVVCGNCGPAYCWAKYAGCTNCQSCQIWNCSSACIQCVDNKFAQGVQKIIDLYLSEFQNKPVILQLGNGVKFENKGSGTVIKPVLDYAIPKYGMRVLLKTNGWHYDTTTPCDWGHGGICPYFLDGSRPDLTKYGLEPGFPTNTYQTEAKMIECGKNNSYACLQPRYWGQGDGDPANLQNFRPLRESLARSLGAKVVLKSASYPEQMQTGQSYSVSVILQNLGPLPPFRPQRVGIKDVASSYQISFELVKDNRIYFRSQITPNPPTNQWRPGQEISLSHQLTIPNSLFSGSYDLKIGLWDPDALSRTRQEYFRVLNKDLLDNQGRVTVGSIIINGLPPECSQKPAGDLNCDNQINGADFDILKNSWGTAINDLNQDGQVDEKDLTILLKNWLN